MAYDSMVDAYKAFLLSDDLMDWVPWLEAVQEDNLANFLLYFEDDDNPLKGIIDPIEIVIAHKASTIFKYFLEHTNYDHYYNQLDYSLLMLLAVFDAEEYIDLAEHHWQFDDDDRFSFFDYVIQTKDARYAEEWFLKLSVSDENLPELLKLSMMNPLVYRRLLKKDRYFKLLSQDEVQFHLITHYPTLLDTMEHLVDLWPLLERGAFNHVVSFHDADEFKKTLEFLLQRGWHLNDVDAYGIPLIHAALRHAAHAHYIDILLERGASVHEKTAYGYPSAHQLLLRDATFTLEVSHLIDLNETDRLGLKLRDYDVMDQKSSFDYHEILLMLQAIYNLDEPALEQLDEDEFYDLASYHDVLLFTPYLTVIECETAELKEALVEAMQHVDFDFYDAYNLKHVFQTRFNHKAENTLQINLDIADIDPYLETLIAFAKETQAPLVISSEGYEINQTAQLFLAIDPSGTVTKKATIHSHMLDIYFIHRYYGIPLEGIEYVPMSHENKRFLH